MPAMATKIIAWSRRRARSLRSSEPAWQWYAALATSMATTERVKMPMATRASDESA